MQKLVHRTNYNIPGHAHELTWTCYHQFPFLSRERACQWLAESIESARVSEDFDLWAYVFMPEHVHMIVRPRQEIYDIATIRQAIKEPAARTAVAWLEEHAPEWLSRITVTKKDRTRRHFWQNGGGYDRNIESSKAILQMIEYIHLNPVRRGLVERAVDWKWSSASWIEELIPGPIRLDPIPPDWVNG